MVEHDYWPHWWDQKEEIEELRDFGISEVTDLIEQKQRPSYIKICLYKSAPNHYSFTYWNETYMGEDIMKKFISVVLIVACLSLSACNKYNKDSINSAFYSYDSIDEFVEERGYIESGDLNDELYDKSSNAYFDDYEDIANEIVGDKLIYEYSSMGNVIDVYVIMDVNSFYNYSMHLDYSILRCQGLFCRIKVYEDPTGDLEGYEKTSVTTPPTVKYIELQETSAGVRISYTTFDYDGFGQYVALLSYQDTETGNIVVITYNIPTEDNEEEIQELRDLGIPVITDYIE